MNEKYIIIQGLNVRYIDEGIGDTILILHGWASSIDAWKKVVEELVVLGFRAIALDLPGFGQSDEPKEIWSLKNYSQFINFFTKTLDLPNFTLLGHSFGGRIAIDYSIRHSRDLHALVLVAAAGIIRHRRLKAIIFLLLTKFGNLIFLIPKFKFLKNIIRNIWYKITGEHDYKKASHKMQQIMKSVLRENIRQYLPRITQYTLILWGENDKSTPVSDAYILHKEISLTSLLIFKQMPHALNLKIPKEIAQEISNFLDKLNKSY